MSTLGGFLDIRQGERRNTLAAFATLLAITTGHTLLETARDAFFLAKMPASRLPVMYLVIVVLALGLSQIKAARADSKWGVAGSLAVAAVITTVFWTMMLGGKPTPTVLYALYVWTGLFGSWAMVQVWTLLGRVHTMTQAKRLYGFIGAGAVLGGVVGAVLARLSISLMSPRSAVLLAAGIFLLSALPCTAIKLPPDEAPRTPRDGRGRVDEEPRRLWSATVELLWDHAFARRVLGIVLVSTITVTVVDYLFKAQLAQTVTDTRLLGKYLSTFYGVTNALGLVTQLVVAPWVFRRVGVQRALFFFPMSIMVAAAAVLGTGGALIASVVLKGLDGALRYSVHKTSTELLLVPVPDLIRERIKPIVDLVGSRGGQALASVGILALVAVGAASSMTLGAMVFGLAVLWVALVVTIRKAYLDVFRETLRMGGLSGKAELPELDLGALETLFTGLNSNRDIDVISSLELLAEQHRERLIPALILYHPSRDVVMRALDIFTEMGRTDFVSIADRLNTHPDREVAAAALRARTAAMPNKEMLLERVDDASQQVAVTALVALMARGWIDEADAEKRLAAAMSSKSWETAAELARAIRAVAPKNGKDGVEKRLDDVLLQLDEAAPRYREAGNATEGGAKDLLVRLEVARAMEARRSPRFLPALVRMLNRHELRAAARAALVAIPGALEALDQAMSTNELPRDIRIHLPRTICLFGAKAAAAVLLRHLRNAHDGVVRFKVIRGLVKLRRNNPQIELDPSPLTRLAEETLEHAEQLRRWGEALSSADATAPVSLRVGANPLQAAHHLLVDLVHDKELHATQRVFLLLELINGDPFDDIWRGLRSKNPKAHASSLELVENLVQPPLRDRILELVSEKVGAVEEARPPLTYEAAIREILAHRSTTMRTLAAYRAVELGIDPNTVPRAAGADGVNPLAESLGEKLLGKVRDVLAPEGMEGATRAPA
ncbi:MAG: lyase domain protein repeat-containing protein [Myxococcaceae bacterium]|nr:lyase domain protein repeat-containing protein [Myxococcaceae bacterium]